MDIDFELDPITEEEVISILGTDYKTQGDELVWACPSCRMSGGDKAADNLKFNRSKHVLKCFACEFGMEITSIIARRRFEAQRGEDGEGSRSTQTPYINNYQIQTKAPVQENKPKEKEIPQDQLDVYYWNCMVALMKRKDILRKMFEKHTILPKTALDCGIGYDENKDMLVFPSKAIGKDPTSTMNYDLTPNGAEYREYQGDKTIRRISGYDSKICCVYSSGFAMHGIICEGYKDAYNLIQLLKMIEPEKLSYTAIFTVQNGTNSINSDLCLQKVNWRRFEEIGVLMDDDKAGNEATELALDLFNNMTDLRRTYLNGYNDIQARFKAEFADKIDIEKALQASWLNDFQNEDKIPF